jgi:hypothetical protein
MTEWERASGQRSVDELYPTPPVIPSLCDGQDDDDESKAERESEGSGKCVRRRAEAGHRNGEQGEGGRE